MKRCPRCSQIKPLFNFSKDHEEIRSWLERALSGKELLPKLTADEHPYLGVLRLEKTLWPMTRKSINDGCLELIRRFAVNGTGEPGYLQELLFLATAYRNPEAVVILAQMASRFPAMPQVSVETRLAVLAALVDIPPPQIATFWDEIFKQDPKTFVGLALSGKLAVNLAEAIKMLPAMPDTERTGQLAALKFDLTWDNLTSGRRAYLVREVESILPRCGSSFVAPVREWAVSKHGR